MFSFDDGVKSFSNAFRNLIVEENYAQILAKMKDYDPDAMVDHEGKHLLHLLAELNCTDVIKYCVKSKYKLDIEDASGLTPMLIAARSRNYLTAYYLHCAQIDRLAKEVLSRPSIPILGGPPLEVTISPAALRDLKNRIEKSLWPKIIRICEGNDWETSVIGEIYVQLSNLDLLQTVKLKKAYVTRSLLELEPTIYIRNSDFLKIVKRFDAEQVKVLTTHQFNNQSLMRYFIELLVHNIADYNKNDNGRIFLRVIFSWDELNGEALGYFVEELQFVSEKNIEIFLEYGFHLIAKEKWNVDILGSLFGNHLVDATLFVSVDEHNVDKRAINDNTALHFAAKSCILKNIEFLLRKQADPNAMNSDGLTPLSLALTNSKPNLKCIEKLIFGGAEFLTIEDYLTDVVLNVGHDISLTDKRVVKIIAAQMAIIFEKGLLDQTLLQAYNHFINVRGIQQYFVRYCDQIKDMAAHIVHERKSSAITVFTFISNKVQDNVLLINKSDLEVINKILRRKKTSWDSHYQKMIRKRIKQIAQIYRSKEKLAFILCRSLKIQDPHHLVVRQILGYFGVKDFLYSRYT